MANNVRRSRNRKNRRKSAREKFWSNHEKADYECPDCGRGHRQVEVYEVHHLDTIVHNNDLDNLVALCKLCHALREGRNPGVENIQRLRDQFHRLQQTVDMNACYESIDLNKYAATSKNPYDDRQVMLAACVRARESGSVSANADPPTPALKEILAQAGVKGVSGDLPETMLEMASEVFHQEISQSDVSEDDMVNAI